MTNTTLFDFTLHLADNALILGHRNSEWCGHGPILEQDIAVANIALDLIGQARNFYQYAAQLKNDGATEDSLAYLRDVIDFKNCLMVELPNGHWGQTILRLCYFSAYQYFFYRQLQNSTDTQLAAIAEKALKEVTYHLRWSSEWVIRLGDGTTESREKMLAACEAMNPFIGELFQPAVYESAALAQGFGVDLVSVQKNWAEKIKAVMEEATLPFEENGWAQSGGKNGVHTEHLGYILAEMQFLQRAYPDSTW